MHVSVLLHGQFHQKSPARLYSAESANSPVSHRGRTGSHLQMCIRLQNARFAFLKLENAAQLRIVGEGRRKIKKHLCQNVRACLIPLNTLAAQVGLAKDKKKGKKACSESATASL